jgi:hypothetical protein
MLYFPQLSSGALTQYPISKQRSFRTIANATADGRTIKAPDYGSAEIAWEMRHSGLTDDELAELKTLFQAAEGRLNHFTFLDPMSNLLMWSEDPNAVAWTRGPLLNATPTNDPLGTLRASRISNTGAADQSLEQPLSAPGWFQYCFSAHVKSGAPARIELYRLAGGQIDSASADVDSSWRRVVLSGRFANSTEESVVFGIRLAPGETIDVFGLQVEAQVNPSAYKPSTTRTGVYSNARFSEDTLRTVTHGVGQHAAAIRIEAAIRS